MAKILILDDDKGMREFLEIMLSREGYDVTCAFEKTSIQDRVSLLFCVFYYFNCL